MYDENVINKELSRRDVAETHFNGIKIYSMNYVLSMKAVSVFFDDNPFGSHSGSAQLTLWMALILFVFVRIALPSVI